MSDIDWTEVIVAGLGVSTALATIAVAMIYTRKPSHGKDEETQAVKATSTPASPGTGSHDAQAIELAHKAMDQVTALSSRLTVVEEELGFMRSAYSSLYWWGRKLRRDWKTVRELTEAPPFPDDVHHPS